MKQRRDHDVDPRFPGRFPAGIGICLLCLVLRLAASPADSLFDRAFDWHRQGELDSAARAYDHFLEYMHDSSPSLLRGRAHANRGLIHRRRGQVDSALVAFADARHIYEQIAPERLPRLLQDMAACEGQRLRPRAAGSLLASAESLAVVHDPRQRIRLRVERIELAVSQGHAGRADALLLGLPDQDLEPEQAVSVRLAQGNLHKLNRDFDEARRSYRKALDHATRIEDARLKAVCYNNLGALELAAGTDPAIQLACFDSSLAAIRLEQAPRTWLRAQQNRGIVLDNMERYDEAAQVFAEVGREAERRGLDAFRIACLKDHGDLLAHQGMHEGAIELYREAARRADSLDRTDLLERALEAIGDSRLSLGETRGARDTWALAQEVVEEERRSIQLDHSRRIFLESRRSIPEKRIGAQLALGEAGPALETLDGMKARTLLDQMEGAWLLLDEELPPEERDLRRELERTLGEQHRALLRAELQQESRGEETRRREAYHRARRALESCDLELFGRHPRLVRQAGDFPSRSTREMARLLQENQLAVSWLVEEERITAFCLRSKGRAAPDLRVIHCGMTRSELRALINEMRRDWADQALLPPALRARPGPGSAEAILFDRLLLPVLADHEDVEHLLLLPDRELHDLPFHALYDCRTDHRVAQELQLSTAPSFRVLAELRLTGTRGREELLVLGAGAERQTRGLGLLPGVDGELRAIEGVYGRRARFLRDTLATESRLKELAPEYGVLHFAAHCRIDPERPAHSAILLQDDTGEDGLLEAREIARLELDADLAVLSACNTHAGPLAGGEGVLGLSRAFFSARVPTVIASLWAVDDRQTAAFMELFYGYLAGGHRPLAALHHAQRELLHRDPLQSPLDWGGFVILGDCD